MGAGQTVSEETAPVGTRGFFSVVIQNANPRDVVTIALIPLILVLVSLVPEATRDGFVFNTGAPELVAAYTTHFVHAEPTHLLGNIIIYLVVASLAYVLAVIADRRQLFLLSFGALVVLFPFALSLMQLSFPDERLVFGFSGINAGFYGLLSILLVCYVRTVFSERFEFQYAPVLLFAIVGGVALVSLPERAWRAEIAAVSFVLAIGYIGAFFYTHGRPDWSAVREGLNKPGYVELAGGSLGTLAVFPVIGFQDGIVTGGAVVDVYVHLLGFCFAFIVLFLYVVVEREM